MVTRLLIVYLLIIFVTSQATLLQSSVFAQQSTSDTVENKSEGKDISKVGSPRDKLLLDYVALISHEEEKHRTFLYWMYSSIIGLTTVLSGLMTWFYMRSLNEVKKSVDEIFHRKIEEQFEEILSDLRKTDSDLQQKNRNTDIYFRALAHVIVVTSNVGNGQKPFDERELKGKRILWVDDKQYNIRDYKILLESLEVKITTAKTTSEAVDYLESEERFNLIITNLGRANDGGKNAGLDLFEAVRAWEKKVVIFTRQDNIDRCRTEATNRKLGELRIVSGFSGILNAIVDILA